MGACMLKHFKQFIDGKFDLYQFFGKRLFDFLFSIISIIILSPLIISISILIRLFDPGPLFFKHKRIGLNEKIFEMYKFRSMPVGTKEISSDKISKVELTWVGKLIRRTNIDELPQLINILKGDMSIVGPRPALLTQKDLIQSRRQNGTISYRPGLTGLAQVSSYTGMSVHKKVQFDEEYINSISLKFDLIIIFKTFIYLLKPPPIY